MVDELGIIVEDRGGERIVCFRSKTFLHLMGRLMELMGDVLGATVLHQMGVDIGRSGFAFMKDEIKTDTDLTKLPDSVWSRRGWGRIMDIEVIEADARTYRVTVKENPISGRFNENEPACHVVRGVFTGFFEAYSGKRAKLSRQVACAAKGQPNCVFEVVFDK